MNLHEEIQDELKQVAPHLASLPKTHPFTTPENYFESVEMKLASSIKNDKAILAMPNEHPFNVPENYFDELPLTILLKIKNAEIQEKEISRISFVTRKIGDYKLWLAAASVAAVLLVSVLLFMNHHSTNVALNAPATEITASDLLYASEVDDAMVVDLYLQDQQQTSEQNNSSTNFNDDTNFLRDVADIDPNSITEM